MLTIERVARELRSLPILARLGLVLLLGGGVADVLAHLGTRGAEHGHEFTSAEVWAHVVAVVGMVVVLLGVVIDGVRQPHPDGPVGDSAKGGA